MRFYMPTVVLDEADCVKNHAKELAGLGTKALIITGSGSSKKNGSLEDVTEALKAEGKSWSIFSGVEENPSVETVMKARDHGLSEGADFVIGVGGGSPLDAAKAAALMMKYPEAGISSLYGGDLAGEALPVAAVPTTCGTGSEVTGVSVLTRGGENKKKGSIPYRIFPKLALIDGKYLKGAPKSVINNTAVDALSHIIESCLMKKANAYSWMTGLQGLKVWAEIKDVLAGDKEAEDEDRQKLMRAAALGGMTIAQTGTTIPHALSYALTINLNVPHGKAVGYFLGSFLAEAPAKERELLLNAAGFSDIDSFNTFIRKVLGETEVGEDVLEKAYISVKDNKARTECNIFEVDESIVKRITFNKNW